MGIVEVAALAASAEGGPPAAISTATCSGDEFGGEVTQLLIATFRPPKRDHQILSLDKSGFAQPVAERGDETCGFSGRAGAKKPDHRHGRLLRARRQRPCRRAAAEQRDELAPLHHSITSSTRARMVAGTSSPSALAVARLMTSSNLVDCCTGRLAGFSPLRIWPA